jgi:hypothetical protein
MTELTHIILNISVYVGVLIFIVCLIISVNTVYKKKPKEFHWNYRVGTRITKTPIGEYREYLIFTGYYTNEVLDSYGISDINYYDDFDTLKFSIKKMRKAFKKPIIDLDNFPSIFVPEKD